MLTNWTGNVPQVVRQKMNQIWLNLGQHLGLLTYVGSSCPICLEFLWIGERHLNCGILDPKFTCIICSRDERFGNHTQCKQDIVQLRRDVIELFRN